RQHFGLELPVFRGHQRLRPGARGGGGRPPQARRVPRVGGGGARRGGGRGGRTITGQLDGRDKDPVYVCADVDVAAAAAAVADGAFYNTGQSCCSVERVYGHESIHDEFVDAFLAAVKRH